MGGGTLLPLIAELAGEALAVADIDGLAPKDRVAVGVALRVSLPVRVALGVELPVGDVEGVEGKEATELCDGVGVAEPVPELEGVRLAVAPNDSVVV